MGSAVSPPRRGTPEFCGVAERRCPGPTPSDVASPVCPSRHHKAGYGGQLPTGLQRMPLSRLPFKRAVARLTGCHPITIFTSQHRTIGYYIAPTDPTGVGPQGIWKPESPPLQLLLKKRLNV